MILLTELVAFFFLAGLACFAAVIVMGLWMMLPYILFAGAMALVAASGSPEYLLVALFILAGAKLAGVK